jgi:hypothetical protein
LVGKRGMESFDDGGAWNRGDEGDIYIREVFLDLFEPLARRARGIKP